MVRTELAHKLKNTQFQMNITQRTPHTAHLLIVMYDQDKIERKKTQFYF